METIADKLRYIRAQRNLNQEKLANELGITRSYLSCIENGIKKASARMETKVNIMYNEVYKDASRVIQETIDAGTKGYSEKMTDSQLLEEITSSYNSLQNADSIRKCWHLHNLSIFAGELARRIEKEIRG